MKNLMHRLIILSLLALTLSSIQAAQDQPLLMAGKTSLYQRILAIPGSQLVAQAGDTVGTEVSPFTSFYVYQRKQIDGAAWLQVGTDRHGQLDGWLPADNTLQWNQGLTVVFQDPSGHDRSLLFKNKDALKQLVNNKDPDAYQALYKRAASNQLADDSPVVAIQPAGHIDVQKDFYLVPIRDHEDIYLGNEQARMLQISSVPLRMQPPPAPEQEAKPAVVPAPPAQEYRSGLAFVIDSTLSMDTYIDRTREAVMKIYDQLGDSGLLGSVNFGLVAFRDNLQASPGLEYVSRMVVTLEQGSDPGVFIDKVNNLSAATSSSKGFKEDAYSGVKLAIEQMNWEQFDARYLVLITDAGAREGEDPLSTTSLSTEQLRQLAIDNNIAIFVLHLLTEAQMPDHEADAQQYNRLSDFPGVGSLYYGVSTGDVNEFGSVLDSLASQLTEQVKQATQQDDIQMPEPVQPPPQKQDNPQLAALQAKVARLGFALRMQYLQKTQEQPPRIFDAWILDRDFTDPQRRTLDVRVLLTRDQLSDLHDVLKQVLVTAEEGLLSPQNFLNELKSLAATISRNPEELGSTTATTAGQGHSLADMGFISEYTEDLPYTSEVMNLSLEDWQSWSARQQISFLNRLEAKISYYRALHDHTDLWTSLDKGPVDGDAVFPIPLDMLP